MQDIAVGRNKMSRVSKSHLDTPYCQVVDQTKGKVSLVLQSVMDLSFVYRKVLIISHFAITTKYFYCMYIITCCNKVF